MAVLFVWWASVFNFWYSLRRLPYAEYLPSGLKRVAALFFGRECTILRPGRVKDFAAQGLACLRDALKISTPFGVVFSCAFLDTGRPDVLSCIRKIKFNQP